MIVFKLSSNVTYFVVATRRIALRQIVFELGTE